MKAIAGALVFLAVASAARGQVVSLRGEGGVVWVRSDSAGMAASLSGPAAGGEGRIDIGPVLISGEFVEGQLSPLGRAGGGASRTLVEGATFVGVRCWPWLELAAGPRIRAYVSPTGSERWVWWQGLARVEAPIVSGSVSGYAELWRSFASRSNVVAHAGRVQGAEVGLVLWPRGTWSVRLAYGIDDALLAAADNETVEALRLGVGWRP